jgi:hypothetical protein
MARFLDHLLPLKCQRRRFDAATQKQGRHLKKNSNARQVTLKKSKARRLASGAKART